MKNLYPTLSKAFSLLILALLFASSSFAAAMNSGDSEFIYSPQQDQEYEELLPIGVAITSSIQAGSFQIEFYQGEDLITTWQMADNVPVDFDYEIGSDPATSGDVISGGALDVNENSYTMLVHYILSAPDEPEDGNLITLGPVGFFLSANSGCNDDEACNYNADNIVGDGDDNDCEYPINDLIDCEGNCQYPMVSLDFLVTRYWEVVFTDCESGDWLDSTEDYVDFNDDGTYVVYGTENYELHFEGTYTFEDCFLVLDDEIGGVSDQYQNLVFDAGKGCLTFYNTNYIDACGDPAACNYIEGFDEINDDCDYPEPYYDCDYNCIGDQNENEICDAQEGYAYISDPDNYYTYFTYFEVDYSLEDNFVPGSIYLKFYDQESNDLLSTWNMADTDDGEFTYRVGEDPSTYYNVASATGPVTSGNYKIQLSYMIDAEDGFEYVSEIEHFQVAQIAGCRDDEACNYDPNANEDGEPCEYAEINLSCNDDIVVYAEEGATSAIVNYTAPETIGGCGFESFLTGFPDFDQLPAHVENNYMEWLTPFSNLAVFAYDGDYNEEGMMYEISDGLHDMYDGGNELYTNFAEEIPYTSGAIINNDAFGEDTRYFTQELPGMFFLAAEMNEVEYFIIDGNIGADGDGAGYTAQYEVGDYTCYFKGIDLADDENDPSINQLIIIPTIEGVEQFHDASAEDDYHEINGISEANVLYYFLWAGQRFSEIDLSMVEQFIGYNGNYNVQLIDGLESGSEFPVGTNEVDYLAILGGNEYQICSFDVTVLSTGCTDENACNYSELANEDDGSCEYPMDFEDCDGNCLNDLNENDICDELEDEGCTDQEACNYSESANIDDGSCEYPEDLLDCDGNCLNDENENNICDEIEVAGCMDDDACNYNAEANVDDESCDYPGEYLDCEGNCNNDFNENGICDEAEVQGCMNPEACNYSEEANVENGSCEFPMPFMDCEGNCLNDENENDLCDETEVTGCTDEDAVNYNADATFDDDSCIDECAFPEVGILNISCDDELMYVELSVDANNTDGLFYFENSANNQTLVLQDGSSVLNLNFPYGEDVIATIQSNEYESCSMELEAFACAVSVLENATLEVNMYPNPANNLVRIATGKIGLMNVTLLDLTGKLILDQSTYMGVEGIELNVSDLANGTYLVRITDGDSVETRKLMILRE